MVDSVTENADADDTGEPLSRGTVILESVIAALITAVAGYLALTMPSHVSQGGLVGTLEFTQLSPVFFPELSFGATALTAFILLVRSVRDLRSLPAPSTAEPVDIQKYINVAIMCAIVIAYAYLLTWLGYGFATMVAIAVVTYFLGNRVWWNLALFSTLTPIVTRFVFERLLSISLPRPVFDSLARVEEAIMQFLTHIFFLR